MLKSFFNAFLLLVFAAGAGYASAQPGSRSSKPAATPAATDGSGTEVSENAAEPQAAPAPAAPPAKSLRARTREAARERAAALAREAEEATADPASPSTAPGTKASRARTNRDNAKERSAPVPAEGEQSLPLTQATAPVAVPAPESAEQQQPAPVEASAPATPAVTPEMGPELPIMRALGGVGIVLTLMIGGFFVTRRFAPQLFQKPSSEKTLKVVETVQMGDKRSIAIVQVGEKRLLVGNTSSRITLLAALDNVPEGESARISPAIHEPSPKRVQASAGNFRNIFELEKRPAAPRGAGAKTIAPDIRAKMRQLRESLEQ